MIIGIDFDGTIVYNKFPRIGKLKPNAKKIINKLYNEGHDILINSCRSGNDEILVTNFLNQKGIKFHEINKNSSKTIELYDVESRKLSCDMYIDDKNYGGIPDDWNEIYVTIKNIK